MKTLFAGTALASASFWFASPAAAQDRVFTGPGTDWTDPGNWNGADVPDGAGETAVLQNNGAPTSLSIGSTLIVGGIRYEAGGPARTINVGAILSVQGSGIANQSSVIQTFNVNGAVAGSTSLQLVGSADLTGTQTDVQVGNGYFQIAQQANATRAHASLNGGILSVETTDGTATLGALSGSGFVVASLSNGAVADQVLTLGGLNLSTTFSGSITQNPGSTLGLTLAGTGTLTLTGSSNYTGTTTISAGTLQIGNGGTAGSLGATSVVNNATLAFNRSNAVNFANAISGSGVVVQSGAGALTLSGANSYSGGTTLNAGSIVLGSAGALGTGALTFAGSGTVRTAAGTSATVNGVAISAGASGTLAAAAGDTLTLTGALQMAGAAGTQLHFGAAGQAGTVVANFSSVGFIPNAGSAFIDAGTLRQNLSLGLFFLNLTAGLSIASGATFDINGSLGAGVNLTGGGTITNNGASAAQFQAQQTAATIFGGVIRDGSQAISLLARGGGTLVLTGASTYSGATTFSNNSTLQIGNGGTTGSIGSGAIDLSTGRLVIDRSNGITLANAISGSGSLTQNGSGTTTLTGANSYSGGTTLNAGSIVLGSAGALGTGALTFAGSGTARTAAGTSATVNGVAISAGASGTLAAAAGDTLTLTGALQMAGAAGTQLHFGAAGQTGTVFANFSSVGFIPNAGAAFIDAGTLRQNLSLGLFFLNLTGGLSIASGATFDLNGSLGAGVNLTGGGTITNDGSSAAQFQAQQTAATTFGGVIRDGSQAISLLTRGGGTLVLTSANTYSGATTFSNNSTLQIGNGGMTGSIGSGGIDLSSGRLVIDRSNGITLANAISGTGTLTKNGGGTMTLTGANSYSGGTTLNAGTIEVGSNNALGTGTAVLNGVGLRGIADVSLANALDITAQTDNRISAAAGTSLTLAGHVSVHGVSPGLTTVLRFGSVADTGRIDFSAPAVGNTIFGGPGVFSMVVEGGTLRGVSSALSFFTANAASVRVDAGATLDFSPTTASVGEIGTLTGAGTVIAPDLAASQLRIYAGDFSGAITGNGGLNKSGSGTLILTGTNSYAGETTISGGGTLQIGNGGAAGSIANSSRITNNGQLIFNTSGATSLGLLVGAGTLAQSGPGTLALSGVSTAGNDFTGTINVAAGTVLINGQVGDASNLLANLTVASGATLGGSGTFLGDVTMAGTGQINPGNSPGTLTIAGDLSLSAGTLLNYELSQPGVVGGAGNDLINVGGDLVLDGTLNVANSGGGAFGAGVYRLINYGGALTDNALAIGAVPAGANIGAYQVQTGIAGQVNLIAVSANLLFWDGGTPANANNGQVEGGSGIWSATAPNWTESNGAANGAMAPQPGFAIFQSAPGTVTVDASAGAVGVTGMQFALDGYRIAGDAITLADAATLIRVGDGTASSAGYSATIASRLTGSGGLVKDDLGTLILTGQNDYAGATSVNAGTLVLGDGTAAAGILGAITLAGDAALDLRHNASIGGDIVATGAGSHAVTVAGTLGGTYDAASGSAADTLTLAATGAIAGANLGGGNDSLLYQGGSFSGLIDGGAGSDSFTSVLAGTASIDQANLGGFEALAHQAGTLTLTGAGATDTYWSVSGGAQLTMDGQLVASSDGAHLDAPGASLVVGAAGSIRSTGGNAVRSDGGAITNDGSLASDNAAGASLSGGTTLANSGTITGGAGLAGWGVLLAAGDATITNLAGGSIAAVAGGQGAIALNGAGAVTLDLQAGSTVTGLVRAANSGARTVNVAGTLDGFYDASGNSGVDTVTMVAGGSMTGANLGAGNDSFTYYGGTISGIIDGDADMDTLYADFGAGNSGTVTLANFVNFESFRSLTGNVTYTGPSASPAATIYANSGTTGFTGTQTNTGDIYIDGGNIRANTAGAFGTGTIHFIDPTAFFGATGTYANNLSLEVQSPATANPSTLSADAGIVATLTGAITQGTGAGVDPAQPLVIAGAGTIVLTNTANSWSGVTTINAGATLQGMSNTISGSSIAANGTLAYVQPASGTVAQDISGTGRVLISGLAAGERLTFTGNSNVGGGFIVTDGSGVANSGGITGFVSLANGGSLANLGSIAGYVASTGPAAATLANSGSVSGGVFNTGAGVLTLTNAAGGTIGTGISATGGATSTTIANAGSVTGGATAVYVTAGALDLGNAAGGTITGNDAVRFIDGIVNNAGTLTGLTGNGVTALGAATVSNLAGGVINAAAAGGQGISGLGATLTATNAGTINAESGVVKSGGTGTLANSGTINAAQNGVLTLGGGLLAVTNTGMIASNDAGVRFAAGGSVTNNAGSIAGTANGIASTGGALSIVNNASLSGGANAILSTGAFADTVLLHAGSTTSGAIALGDGADQLTVVGTLGGNVDLGSGNDTLTLVAGTALAGMLDGGADVDALVLTGTGSANLDVGTALNFETRAKTGAGIWTLTGNDASTSAWQVDAGTLALSGGTAVNDTAVVTLAASAALRLDSSEQFASLNGAGTVALGANTLTLGEGGTYAGVITGSGSLTLAGGTLTLAGGTLTLSGANTYTGLTSISAGTLRLAAAERLADASALMVANGATFDLAGYTETVATLTGNGTLALGAGRLVLAGNADQSFAGAITGSGSLDKHGSGRLTLAGSYAATGRFDVTAGTLGFDGTSAGSIRVQGGALIGQGTLADNLTIASGSFAPGGLSAAQPIGSFQAQSLNVTGGSLLFDFGGANVGFAADSIRVTGPAVLAGGTVNVNALSVTSQYGFQQNYTILQAGTLSGTFASGATFANVGNDAGLKWRLRYDLVPNAVVLQVQKQLDFAAAVAGGSANQLAVGNALSGAAGMASDSWADTLNTIVALSPTQRGPAYDSLSGEVIADTSTSTIMANTLFLDLLRNRIGDGNDQLSGAGFASSALGDVRVATTQGNSLASRLAAQHYGSGGSSERGGAVWGQAFGGLQKLSGLSGQAGLETTAAGLATGAEGRIGSLTFGIAGGYTEITGDVNARNATLDGRLVQAGGYASYDDGAAFVNLAGNYYWGKFDTLRLIELGSAVSSASGRFDNQGYSLGVTAGYRADLGGGLRAVAIASATQTHDSQDAFTERAGGGLGLASAAAKRDVFTATGEARLGQWIKTGAGSAMPYVSLGVRYNAGDLDTLGNMRFAGAPTGTGAFQVRGAKMASLLGTFGAGIDVKASERVSLGIAVENAYADRVREGRASMRIRIGF